MRLRGSRQDVKNASSRKVETSETYKIHRLPFIKLIINLSLFTLADLVDYVDNKNLTAIMHAVVAKSIDCVALLIEAGAKLDMQDTCKRSALFLATQEVRFSSMFHTVLSDI